MVQWFPQAQFAGYIVAHEKGFYDEAGIDATILFLMERTVLSRRCWTNALNSVLDGFPRRSRYARKINRLSTSARFFRNLL